MSAPVALITGGGSGIGLAVAEHLINHYGYRVGIVDINATRAAEQAARIGSQNCLGIHADVCNYDQLADAFLQTFLWGGNRLDLFFGNAGIGDSDSMYKDMALDEHTGLPLPLDLRCIDVDLLAVMQGVHLARHFFAEKNDANAKKGGKRVVVTSSVLGLYANHALPQYVAAKHGLVGFVRSCAPVYARDGISINSINPTLVDTNIIPPEALADFLDGQQASPLTPLSTVLKAFDAILADESLTGQVMELALDDVVLKPQPEFSRPNTKWMCERMDIWEKAVAELMPREPGHNAVQIHAPSKASF